MANERDGGAGSGIYEINDSYISNKPPSRYLTAPTPHGGKITRGQLTVHGEGQGTAYKGMPIGTFQFHFNPERLDISYEPLAVDMHAQLEADTPLPGMIEGAYTVDFTLLLNRQFDVVEGITPRGTLEDIEVLLNLVGYNGELLTMRGARVVFGTTFSFYGFIKSMSVTHHQFTSKMVPVWTTIALSMSNLPEMFSGALGADPLGNPDRAISQPQGLTGSTAIGLSPGGGPLR